jgi:hypothetical protein
MNRILGIFGSITLCLAAQTVARKYPTTGFFMVVVGFWAGVLTHYFDKLPKSH